MLQHSPIIVNKLGSICFHMLLTGMYMLVFPASASAQAADFLDEMLRISDKAIEETSEMIKGKKPVTAAETPKKEEGQKASQPPVPPLATSVAEPIGPNPMMGPEPQPQPSALKQQAKIPGPMPEQQGPKPVIESKKTQVVAEPAATLPKKKEPAATLPKKKEPAAKPVAPAWEGSIMFTPAEYQHLRQAISSYERLTGKGAGGAGAIPGGRGTIAGKAPMFYLGSIMYISPTHWAVWLNNKKYTKESVEGNINLASVLPDQVSIIWKTDLLDILVPDWRSKLKMDNSGNHLSEDKAIHVNNTGTEIIFTLRPNQSFVAGKMRVVEGYTKDKP